VLCALGDGGEGLSGWVMGLVLIGDLSRAFVWMETLAESSGYGIVKVTFRLRTRWPLNVRTE
jgi:hypothetical protein